MDAIKKATRHILASGNKQMLWAGFGLAVILIAFLNFSAIKNWFSKSDSAPRAVQAVPSPQNTLLTDDDHDNLQAWEEELYGTHPQNPDTDGDGTQDGEEIKAGRNPLVKGPYDSASLVGKSDSIPSSTKNLTDLIFNEFLRQGGTAAMFQGQSADRKKASEAVSKKVEEFVQQNIQPPTQTAGQFVAGEVKDIKISEDISKTAIFDYLKKVGEIATRNSQNTGEEDDMDLFLEIIQSNDLARLREITPYREAAEKSAKDLRELVAPKSLAWFHAQEIWLTEESAKQLRAFENAENDPASAMAVIPLRVDLKVEAQKLNEGDLVNWLYENKML